MYISSTQRWRSHHFERAKGSALEVMERPEVRQALGASLLGPEAISSVMGVLEHAFLPNVVHGTVEIPKEYRNTDSIPLLPALSGRAHRYPKLGLSTFEPTPSTIGRIAQYAATKYPDVYARPRSADVAAQRVGAYAMHRSYEWGHKALLPRGAYAKCSSIATPSLELGVYVLTRPVIAFDVRAKVFRGAHAPVGYAWALSHEALHAVDLMSRPLDRVPSRVEVGYLESRGYYLGDTLRDAVLPPGSSIEPGVDIYRQQYATPQEPFPMSEAYTDELRAQGLISL